MNNKNHIDAAPCVVKTKHIGETIHMKKIAVCLMAALGLAVTSFAGTEMSGKASKTVEPVTCFGDNEFQIDIFGSYTGGGIYEDGFGGGVSLNYFVTRNIGLSLDGNGYEGDVSGRFTTSLNLVFRLPIDEACIAPYALVGGGVGFDGITEAIINGGIGLEYRVVPNRFGVFAEGRYSWGDESGSTAQARLGVRLAF
jgi:hypothetical protein